MLDLTCWFCSRTAVDFLILFIFLIICPRFSGSLTELEHYFVLNGEMYIVGGWDAGFRTQIAKLESCGIRRIGELPDSLQYAACNTFSDSGGEEYARLCFDLGHMDGCKRYNGRELSAKKVPKIWSTSSFDGKTKATIAAPRTNYRHYWTDLGNWQNKPVAVGGYDPGDVHVEQLEASQWEVKTDFPFAKQHICFYSMASMKDFLYIFGKKIVKNKLFRVK